MGLMAMDEDGGTGTKYFPPARSCDYCESAAALLFCRSDSAFLCIACDSKLHGCHTRHERVWMCEVCEQAAAVVSCRADAAVLCSECDRDIHTANPLARRHERTPVVPFYENAESVVLKTAAAPFHVLVHGSDNSGGVEQAELLTNSSSWVPTKVLPNERPDSKSIEFLFSDSDQLMDLEISQQISSHLVSDCVVPVQTNAKPPVPALSALNQFEIDFTTSNVNSYNNSYTTTPSLSHSVNFSSSSMDLSVVPDGSALSDISYPFSSNVEYPAVDPIGTQGFPVVGLDREARVLRYREKRKNRRFQKIIRYASRKAYAESRPRVKGRFAKRTDGELEGDPVIIAGSPDYAYDARYDVLMSF